MDFLNFICSFFSARPFSTYPDFVQFLNPSTTDISDWIHPHLFFFFFFCLGGLCTAGCLASSWSLPTRCQWHFPPLSILTIKKCSQTLPNVLWGAISYCFRLTAKGGKLDKMASSRHGNTSCSTSWWPSMNKQTELCFCSFSIQSQLLVYLIKSSNLLV